MRNFNIKTQVDKEKKDFYDKRITIANTKQGESVRFLRSQDKGYSFNQSETLAMIDLYHNSQFESGPTDSSGRQKIFLNIGKFRTEVSAKQIDIDTKDIRFLPDDYANPWASYFMQKEFREYAKESYFGEILNDLVDNLPKYGTVVLKKLNRRMEFLPLKNLINDQEAKDLQSAEYVIEQHPNMTVWELKGYKDWNLDGLDMRMDKKYTVYERYGHVPVAWLKKQNGEDYDSSEWEEYTDAMVVVTFDVKKVEGDSPYHVFYAQDVKERPYEEAHWLKQDGRWLGYGVMEDQFSNQQAKNIIVNLLRKSMQWSAKKLFQSTNQDQAGQNLVRDFVDGDVVEVGPAGELRQVDMSSRGSNDYQQFMNEFERNADQKAFTYEVATGESLPSGTPFRLGVVLSNAMNTYFALKREKLGLFLQRAIQEFLIPEFLTNMRNKERVIAMYSGDEGYEALKEYAIAATKDEAITASLLSGQPVDTNTIAKAIEPVQAMEKLFFNLPKAYYDNLKYKFMIDVTGEGMDVKGKVETLTTFFQIFSQMGDPRAEKILERIAALTGEPMSTFITDKVKIPQVQGAQQVNQQANQLANAGGQPEPQG